MILPDAVGDQITNHSNLMASASLVKFRNAISTLAFSEQDDKGSLITNYLSWKELVHTCYFDVPAFRAMVVLAISQSEGFAPTELFRRDQSYPVIAQWVSECSAGQNRDQSRLRLAMSRHRPSVPAQAAGSLPGVMFRASFSARCLAARGATIGAAMS